MFGWLHGLVSALPGDLDLYDAIRRAEARSQPMSRFRRAAALAGGAVLAPVAFSLSVVEAVAKAGGSVYLEARKR
jgi:hypothetical protein